MKAAQDGRSVVERELAIRSHYEPPDPTLRNHPQLTPLVIDPLDCSLDGVDSLRCRFPGIRPITVTLRQTIAPQHLCLSMCTSGWASPLHPAGDDGSIESHRLAAQPMRLLFT